MIKWARVLTVAATLLSVACATTSPHSDAWNPSDDCAVLTVENRAFADVVVYFAPLNKRLGTVIGKTEKDFELCGLGNFSTRFAYRAIGGAFAHQAETFSRLSHGNHIILIIPANPSTPPAVIGEGLGAQETPIDFVNLTRGVQPIYMVAGIFADVAMCLGIPMEIASEVYDNLDWALADTIYDLRPDPDELLYGAYVEGLWEQPTVIIERGWQFNPYVLSHEVQHALGFRENQIVPQCIMPTQADTPFRQRQNDERDSGHPAA